MEWNRRRRQRAEARHKSQHTTTTKGAVTLRVFSTRYNHFTTRCQCQCPCPTVVCAPCVHARGHVSWAPHTTHLRHVLEISLLLTSHRFATKYPRLCATAYIARIYWLDSGDYLRTTIPNTNGTFLVLFYWVDCPSNRSYHRTGFYSRTY